MFILGVYALFNIIGLCCFFIWICTDRKFKGWAGQAISNRCTNVFITTLSLISFRLAGLQFS